MKRISVILLVFSGFVLVACDTGGPSAPTSSGGQAVTSVTQVLFGTLNPGDSPFSSFGIPGTQPLHIMLGSLTNSAGLPLGSTVTLKFGVETTPGSAVCDPLVSVPATAALAAQINVTVSSGAYCVSLADTSGVPGPASYSIRVIYGTPSDASSSGTISYSSTVLPSGFTTRNFAAAFAGSAAVTMDSFSPGSVATLGLALGIPRNDGSGCDASMAIMATPGSQLTAPVDPGIYCVKIFDPGTLTGTANFALRIVHP